MAPYMLRFKPNGKILEIGGGNNPLRDQAGNRVADNLDICEAPDVDIVHNLSTFPWPLKDESYDNIFGKYCLEHLSWHDIDRAIGEIYRILKKGGKGIFFVPNTLAQIERVRKEGINQGTIELLFGSQEFEPRYIGTHKTGFSEEYAKKLFQDAGFRFVKILPHPVSPTDLIIEAYKIEDVFERQYFEDGTYGYKDYRDFATHYSTARIIMKLNPQSVIDIGGGRGYITRLLENNGIPGVCIDISKHCWHTRSTDSFLLWDAMDVPWKRHQAGSLVTAFKDKEFNLAFSINFLEHIPENKLDDVIKEMIRVSNRGLHGIHFTESPYEEIDEDVDITHETIKPKNWWIEKFKNIDPNYNVTLEHPRILEYDIPQEQPPISMMPKESPDGLVKLNVGSYLDMFYYDWTNIDILDLKDFAERQCYKFLQHDITKGIPFEDSSVDIIMSNHFIEHLTREEGQKFLEECYRVLKPKGVIRTSVPDTKLITQRYIDGKIMNYKYINIGVELANDDAEGFYNLLLAGHKTVFDERSLSRVLEKTGFKEIKKVSPFESRHNSIQTQSLSTHPSISLILEAEK